MIAHSARESLEKLQELEEIFFYVSIGDEKMDGIEYKQENLTEIHSYIRKATEGLYNLMRAGQ